MVRRHQLRARTEKLPVPKADHAEQGRQIALQWRLPEVVVHRMGASEEVAEMPGADGYQQR